VSLHHDGRPVGFHPSSCVAGSVCVVASPRRSTDLRPPSERRFARTQSTTVSFMTSCFCVARHIISPTFFFRNAIKFMVKLFLVSCELLARTFAKSSNEFILELRCTSSVFHPPRPPPWYFRGKFSLKRDDSCNITLLPLLSSATKWNSLKWKWLVVPWHDAQFEKCVVPVSRYWDS